MALFIAKSDLPKDYNNTHKQLHKKARAIAHEIQKVHFPSNWTLGFVRSSMFKCDSEEQPYVFQFSLTTDGKILPTYALYIYFDLDIDFTIAFVGTYGRLGAITFETIRGLDKVAVMKYEIERADKVDAYDIKLVWNHKYSPLPERVAS